MRNEIIVYERLLSKSAVFSLDCNLWLRSCKLLVSWNWLFLISLSELHLSFWKCTVMMVQGVTMFKILYHWLSVLIAFPSSLYQIVKTVVVEYAIRCCTWYVVVIVVRVLYYMNCGSSLTATNSREVSVAVDDINQWRCLTLLSHLQLQLHNFCGHRTKRKMIP